MNFINTLRPWIDHILDTFGPDRIVWGADWQVVDTGSGLHGWIASARDLISYLSPDEQSAITERNAYRIYGLTQTEQV